jgi:hypothetical protein
VTTTLVIVGFVLIAAAVIGGGLKAAEIEVVVISSVPRQVALGVVGLVMLVVGFMVRAGDSSASPETPTTPRSPASSAQSPSPTSAAIATSTETSTGADNRYTAVYKDIAFTMTTPQGCSDSSVGVTFKADGPKVETGIATGNVGNPWSADIFYANCNSSTLDTIYVPDNNPFTTVDGDLDAANCAMKANAQPVAKRLPFPNLKPGMGFCLVTQYTNMVVHLKITAISPTHDLTWTATVWTDTHS